MNKHDHITAYIVRVEYQVDGTVRDVFYSLEAALDYIESLIDTKKIPPEVISISAAISQWA